jgi:type III restriction enzyme
LKIPTGGGKTLLACHTIDLINRHYLKKQTGIVLWIVPTTQIYRQTLLSLKDRAHPYRQVLDIASGGRTMILEKTDRFTLLDVQENLAVMMLMLPSANRLNKETLKVFKDSGGFGEFFPLEDDRENNERLLRQFPNLDYFGDANGFMGRVVKTSLGNTLRILKPITIIDEGHKAYSDKARDTILGFNPSIVVELSATPPENVNKLVVISGQQLNHEDMIKLDLHLINKASPHWKDALFAAVQKTNDLREKAKEYDANTGEYIRPICLIQVERTGKDQRGAKFIHAEEAKEYLIKQCGIEEDEIAIKSSEKDDIEGIDLLSKDCHIRFIITKQALQEGWDCPFAYVLTILTNPSSQVSITQLVGRILRQPNARKTKVKELDESYVFSFRQKAKELLENVRKGFQDEGLGDLAGRVTIDSDETGDVATTKEKVIGYRARFKKFEGKIYLPKFVIQEIGAWRDVNYEMDILSRINWSKVKLDYFKSLSLSDLRPEEQEVVVGLSDNAEEVVHEVGAVYNIGKVEIEPVFMTRQILDIVPNPWIAHEISTKVIAMLLEKHDEKLVADNFIFAIEVLRKHLEQERDRLAEEMFRELIAEKIVWFFLIVDRGGYKLPSKIKVKSTAKRLVRDNNSEIQRSLFQEVYEDDMIPAEMSVALYLDEQEKLLWWYRNLARQDYYVQGWKKGRIYPDFVVAAAADKKPNDYRQVYVIETKGIHLKNEDTDYKKNVFELCNKLGQQKDWRELNMEFDDKRIEFQVVFEDEWRERINGIFGV